MVAVRRSLCGGLLAVVCALPLSTVAYAETPPPAAAELPSLVEISSERPEWHPGEPIVFTGRVTSNGQPLVGAPVHLTVDSQADAAGEIRTSADGSWRVELPSRPEWQTTENLVIATFGGDDQHQAASATARFIVAPAKEPISLTVDPLPGPVRPGQIVTLTGMARRQNNQPAANLAVEALVDPGREARAFGSSDPSGRWSIEMTVPVAAGEWSRGFPQYPVQVTFTGDEVLAPSGTQTVLQLGEQPPAEAPSTPTPTPVQTARQSAPAVPPASPRPEEDSDVRVLHLPGGAVLALPRWMVTPTFGILAGAALCLLIGATLLSHARSRRG